MATSDPTHNLAPEFIDSEWGALPDLDRAFDVIETALNYMDENDSI